MKKPFIAVCYQEHNLLKLADILQQMGYRTECCPDGCSLDELLESGTPDLLILDSAAYAAQAERLQKNKDATPIVIAGESVPVDTGAGPHDVLPQPFDVGAIHQLLQRHLNNFAREHLRISVRLPGIYSVDGQDELCDIMSLGTGGLFLRTQSMRLDKEHRLQLVIPLLGMKRELEVSGQVIYQVMPTSENNYHQGVGVQFTETQPGDHDLLKDYISFALLNGQKGIAEPKSYEDQAAPSAPLLGMAMRFS